MTTLKEQLVKAHQLFADVEIPAMPKEVLELTQLFQKEEFPDLNIVEKIISQNATLAGEVIKISNQPQFLRPRGTPVKTIKDALSVIGYQRLQNLLTSVGAIMVCKSRGQDEVSEFNLNVAKITSELSQYTDEVPEDVAYLAGLFHNAGAMLFALKYDNYDAVFLNSLQYGYRAPMLEEKNYGTSHTVAGMLVAKKWQLDNEYSQIMLLHHQKDLQRIDNIRVRTLIAMIQVANAVVIQTLFEDYASEEVQQMLDTACAELMIEEDYLEEFRTALLSE